MIEHWSLRVPSEMMRELQAHLFPGDHDEHGAVIGASVVSTDRGTRLLARRLFLAEDGADYVQGQRGYRMLTPSFVRECALDCAKEGLAYLAIHCHGGTNSVGFSTDDLASHERGYPALLEILNGPPVGAVVFAREAAAGTLWYSTVRCVELSNLVTVGRPVETLFPAPPPKPPAADERFDRQARLLGDRGQLIFTGQKVGVVGAGGVGSLVVEYLARLGVGEIVVIDPDRVELSNLSRVVGSRDLDALPVLTREERPSWLRSFGQRLATLKVRVSRRVAKQGRPKIKFAGHACSVTEPDAARDLIDCDYVFLAADSMQARLVTNALIHQYLIPAIQMGTKAQTDPETGEILQLFVVVRELIPGIGCLWCNQLISPTKLQEEATSQEQVHRQRYVDEPEVQSPAVITLNAIAASRATTDYLINVTGLSKSMSPVCWHKYFPLEDKWIEEEPRRDDDCSECSAAGRLAAGDSRRLPTKMPKAK
jgi:hypothetical protein